MMMRARIYRERNGSWGIEVNRKTVATGYFSADAAARAALALGYSIN